MSLFNNLIEDIEAIIKTRNKKKLNAIWEKRTVNFIDKVIYKKKELDKNFFYNFRSHKKKLVAENPSIKINNFLKKKIYSHQIFYNSYLYNKLIKFNKDLKKYLTYFKLDSIGNPGYCIIDNIKVNERFLRHCHFFSLFSKYVPVKQLDYITDIGGGYGSFARMLHKKYKTKKIIIIDLPEQLVTAKFYLYSNFKNIQISKFNDIYKTKIINKKFISKYDVILVPVSEFKKINIDFKKNIIVNFNSFGEIDKTSFDKYLNSKLIKKSKYLFSVNRIDSFPTYKNNISFIDYKFDIYKKIYFKISPVWDYYFIKKFYLFTTKKIFSSRVIEFIGKN